MEGDGSSRLGGWGTDLARIAGGVQGVAGELMASWTGLIDWADHSGGIDVIGGWVGLGVRFVGVVVC